MEKLIVPLALTIAETNLVLLALAERPLKEVIDLFTKIKTEGDQVARAAAEHTQREVSQVPQVRANDDAAQQKAAE